VVALNTCFPFYEVFHILELTLGIAVLPFVVKEMYLSSIYTMFVTSLDSGQLWLSL